LIGYKKRLVTEIDFYHRVKLQIEFVAERFPARINSFVHFLVASNNTCKM
jgi:hypothetical protein